MAKLEIGNFLVKTIFFFFEKDFGEKECPLKKKRRGSENSIVFC